MRSEEEIRAMLKRVDDILEDERYEDDELLPIAQDTLLWVLDTYVTDYSIEQHFPDDE